MPPHLLHTQVGCVKMLLPFCPVRETDDSGPVAKWDQDYLKTLECSRELHVRERERDIAADPSIEQIPACPRAPHMGSHKASLFPLQSNFKLPGETLLLHIL